MSECYWQNDEANKDVQWWRAKGSDTFGPVGPYIATGIDYNDLQLRLRLNREVKQETRTSQLIHDIGSIVSFISSYVTLHPGDLIFTGTPGMTSAIKPGDAVEVELEGVGVLGEFGCGGQARVLGPALHRAVHAHGHIHTVVAIEVDGDDVFHRIPVSRPCGAGRTRRLS